MNAVDPESDPMDRPLWQPTDAQVARANMTRFVRVAGKASRGRVIDQSMKGFLAANGVRFVSVLRPQDVEGTA